MPMSGLAQAIYQVLRDRVPATDPRLSYQDLLDTLGPMPPPNHGLHRQDPRLRNALGEIGHACLDSGLPPLSSIVVLRELGYTLGQPGKGYFLDLHRGLAEHEWDRQWNDDFIALLAHQLLRRRNDRSFAAQPTTDGQATLGHRRNDVEAFRSICPSDKKVMSKGQQPTEEHIICGRHFIEIVCVEQDPPVTMNTKIRLLLLIAFLSVGTGVAQEPPPKATASLKAKFDAQFTVGVALGGRVPDDYSTAERDLILQQFGSVTPENCMKMAELQPREGEFHFERADALVNFAQRHRLEVVGHTLIWAKDERTPAWVFRDGDKPASRELVLERLRTHVQTVVSRYRGHVQSWDVVNEALDDGEPDLRPSKWLSIVGPEFIAEAFAAARAADPDALLIYNEYNVEQPRKREKLLRLIRKLRAENVSVGAIGIQGHWEVDRIPFRDIEALLGATKEFRLKLMVSELDLGVVPRGRWWADGGKHRAEMAKTNPLAGGCPPELLKRQAEQYAALFRLFSKHSDSIGRVTFWNLHDGRSWLNNFPWKHAEYPLLFDRSAAPKPAFWAVMDLK